MDDLTKGKQTACHGVHYNTIIIIYLILYYIIWNYNIILYNIYIINY